jgi:uncharacterized protein YndB with AHSA1/START domain
MPVKKDPSGRRYVQSEVELPGTPEEIWQAIATGPGVSSWFVPTTVEERVGGKAILDFGFGPGMESVSTNTIWDPPRRFAAEGQDMGPNSPIVATEWTVEARSGGTCLVRVVHSWFASTDEWDNQFEGTEHGWPAFFRILRVYLAHFRGLPSATFQMLAMTSEPLADAWAAVAEPLGLSNVVAGDQVKASSGALGFAGVVEYVGPPDHPERMLRLTEPAPGIAHFFAMPMGGQVCVPVRLFIYGDQAQAVVARERPIWEAWIKDRFGASAPVAG